MNQSMAPISRGKFPVGHFGSSAWLDRWAPESGGLHSEWNWQRMAFENLKEAIRLDYWYPSRCAWCIHKDRFSARPFLTPSNLKRSTNCGFVCDLVWITLDQEDLEGGMGSDFFPLAIEATRMNRCVSWDCAPKEWDNAIAAWHRSLWKSIDWH